MEQRRISMTDLVIGEPLPWDVYDESNKLLLRRGHIIERAQQVEVLIQRGLYVDAKLAPSRSAERPPEKIQERPSALRLVNLATKRLERLLFGLANENEAQAKILEVAQVLTFAVSVNSDVALACILLAQDRASYPVRHSIDAAVVSLIVARSMKKTAAEIESIMGAALTMNIGMLRQQEHFQNKDGELSLQEKDVIRRHPQDSVDILRQSGIDNQAWLSYVLLHHENEDGSGYPLGKSKLEIPENAKIIAIADRYCARVSSRNYRKSLLPNAALRDILMADKNTIDPQLAASFIRELGVYPTGTFVRLQNGEVGVVTGKGKSTTTPIVHALIGPRGAPLSFPIKRDAAKDLFAIREVLREDSAGVRFSMQQLWGDEASF